MNVTTYLLEPIAISALAELLGGRSKLARMLDCSIQTIRNWELGLSEPRKIYRKKIGEFITTNKIDTEKLVSGYQELKNARSKFIQQSAA
jgi:hypothetical protein